MEHVSDSLSAYLDGALSDTQRRDVESHIAACKACRDEIAELKAVSKMVSGLKQVPLPSGFMSRLKNRQAREAVSASGAAQPSWREAFTLRTAAIAVCGVLVSLVAFQHFHYRELAQLGTPMGIVSGAASVSGSGSALTADQFKNSSDMNQLKMARLSVSPPMLANANRAPAAAPAGGAVTNESLQGFLEEDKRRMGIRKVLVKGQSTDEGQPESSLSKKEYAQEMANARISLRAMTSEITRIMDAKASAPVALKKNQPQLLNQSDGTRQAPAAKAPGEPISLAEAVPQSAMDAAAKNETASRFASGGAGGSGKAHARRGRLTSTGRNLTGSGQTAQINVESGIVARSEKELKDAWSSLQTEQATPQVNFDESVFILISAGNAPNGGVKIIRVETAKARSIVHYKQIPVNSGGLVYDYRIVPNSNLPFIFQKD